MKSASCRRSPAAEFVCLFEMTFSLESSQWPAAEITTRIGVSAGVGLLVGLEREWAQKEVGVRTFAIISLLGTVATLISSGAAIAAFGVIILFVALLNVHSLLKDRSLEMTTSASLVMVVLLGMLVGAGQYAAAATTAIVVTMLLAWKLELARFVDALQPQEIRSAVLLALLALVINPLLPNEFIDPWNLINPRAAFLVVLVIAGIGFVNYVLLRLYSSKGLYYAAILGGLVNSTAAVVELSKYFLGQPNVLAMGTVVLLLTNVAMFVRNLIILALFSPAAASLAALPMAIMTLISVLIVYANRSKQQPGASLQLGSPVSLPRVSKFAILFLGLSIAGTLAQKFAGNVGFLGVSVIGGFISSASTTATAAELAKNAALTHDIHGVQPLDAAIATVLTSITSALINIPLVYQQTRLTGLTRRLSVSTVAISLAGVAAMGLAYMLMPLMVR